MSKYTIKYDWKDDILQLMHELHRGECGLIDIYKYCQIVNVGMNKHIIFNDNVIHIVPRDTDIFGIWISRHYDLDYCIGLVDLDDPFDPIAYSKDEFLKLIDKGL